MRTDAFVLPVRGGALLVDKPVGPTSHDVVAWARKALGTKKVGHTGTLDPFASGLLILLFGPATRLAEYVSGLSKTYSATARLGIRTDTHDSEGSVLDESGDWTKVGRGEVETELQRFMGRHEQVPPQFSAKKIDGEAMYRKARRGESVDLEPVIVEVSQIRLTHFDTPDLTFDVTCSAGTYIRALARDLGEGLGVGAHLTALRRTSVGSFSVDAALAGEALKGGISPDVGQWIPAEAAVGHLPRVQVSDDAAERLRNGVKVPLPEGVQERDTPIVLVDEKGLLGIGEISEDQLAPRKILPGGAA